MMRLVFGAVLAASVLAGPMYASTAQEMLETIRTRMQGAKTYIATMKIKVDISFLQAPEATATMWFKAPDKTHIESPTFAMIPKQGADLNAMKLLSQPFTAVDAGTEAVGSKMMKKVRILPIDESSTVAVATAWIDTTLMVPVKVSTTLKKGGTFVAELTYGNAAARKYCLPSFAKLSFDVANFELPKTISGEFRNSQDDPKKAAASGKVAKTGAKDTKDTKAVVEIQYTDYKINVPISDSKFTEKKK